MKNSIWLGVVVSAIIMSCGSSGGPNGMDRSTRIKYEQYLANGERLYAVHCLNCHQDRGQGLAQLYPPLAKSDYLLADIPRAACIIKNGQMEEIIVNGKTYHQMMPGLPSLTNLEIAEILTFVTNSWGNEAGFQSVKDVDVWLQNCEKE